MRRFEVCLTCHARFTALGVPQRLGQFKCQSRADATKLNLQILFDRPQKTRRRGLSAFETGFPRIEQFTTLESVGGPDWSHKRLPPTLGSGLASLPCEIPEGRQPRPQPPLDKRLDLW
jgi:hypothetical protein